MYRSALRTVVLPRAPGARMPLRALHASPVVRDEEKSVAAPASGGMLSDWRVQLPIGFLAAIPLLHNQVFILNEETQLLGCFMVFVGTMYTQAGDMIGKALDAKSKAVIAEHNAQEEVAISAVKAVLAAHQKKLTLVEDMKMVYSFQSEVLSTLAKAKSMELQYVVRADVVKKLDFLVQKEESAKTAQQAMLVSKATAAVEAAFSSNKKLQGAALNVALATLADPSKKPLDVVGKVYGNYFSAYNKAILASKEEMEAPAEVLEAANAEVLAFRKRMGNPNMVISAEDFPKKFTLA
jgi:hypothetical protein